MVTGGNSGVGKETAVGLASLGGKVVIVCRNKNKGEAAWAEVKAKSRNENVDLMLADLSSFKSVRALARSFKAKYGKLDILVNNAGEILSKRHVTIDGLERTLASNHLGHFLLTNLLLDTIRGGAPARIINITSEAHRGAKIHFDDLQGEKNYSTFRAYGQAKLANVLFTYELARKLEGTGVGVN
jgi:NAD(P)-dependent dehydrogenase (short-subunit alcohol dehydrogenase family)